MSRNSVWQTRQFRKQPDQRDERQSSWSQRRAQLVRPAKGVATGLAVALTATLSVWTPGAGTESALAAQLRGSARTISPAARAFNGIKSVGALFTDVNGKLTHFCTASVISSPAGDLLLTAAHCLEGRSLTPAGSVVFGPEYHSGKLPLGTFEVREAFTDSAWQKNHNPDDDFAFLIAGKPGQNIQKKTGAQTLETGARLPQRVQVIGYPDVTSRPITCTNQARAFTRHGLHQLVFDCPGYTDGTSGGPFLVDVKASTGAGQVIGAIGGYEQGGDTPSVSYSAQFGTSIAALYKTATTS
jgi:V8-like Glu-specific endopeptidase